MRDGSPLGLKRRLRKGADYSLREADPERRIKAKPWESVLIPASLDPSQIRTGEQTEQPKADPNGSKEPGTTKPGSLLDTKYRCLSFRRASQVRKPGRAGRKANAPWTRTLKTLTGG